MMHAQNPAHFKYAPTTKSALAGFLIGGPLLWLPIYAVISGAVASRPAFISFAPILGFWLWFIAAASPKFWLLTWIPTASAAVACSYALRVFARSIWYGKIGSAIKLTISAVLCGVISGAIFEVGYQISLIIHPEPSIAEGSPQAIALANYQSQLPAGHHFAMLFGGVPLVVAIGAVLGLWLSWCSMSVNASMHPETDAG
jgi:hypothetical protein